MSWKNEVDRTVHGWLMEAVAGRGFDRERMARFVGDLVGINPARPESHFPVGFLEEVFVHRPASRSADADGGEAFERGDGDGGQGGHGGHGGHGGRGGRGRRGGRGGRGGRGDRGWSRGAESGGAGQRHDDPRAADDAKTGAAGAADTQPGDPVDVTTDVTTVGATREGHASTAAVASPVPAAVPEPMPVLPDSPDGACATWRWLGRLDAAARTGSVERVLEFAADPRLETVLGQPDAGRIALRTLGRSMLASDQEARLFELYARHLSATRDEGSLKDADTLLGDAVRKADDTLSDGDEAEALASLERLLAFAVGVGLEGRVAGKIERKIGRAHQLAGRFADATTRYRAALARLDADDRYRSVLQGDLALSALEVRGTLDLLPREGRTGTEEVERLLTEGGTGGEGESYNAIYTLGVLLYERGEYAKAAERFREADRLMRETRAKARIVHARSRFFLGACILKLGATPEQLVEAEEYIARDAQATALDPAVKQPIFDLLLSFVPDARIGGRGGDRGDRGDRGGRGRGRGRDREPRGEDRPAGAADDDGFIPVDEALVDGVAAGAPPGDGSGEGRGDDDRGGRGGRRRGRRGRGGRGGGDRPGGGGAQTAAPSERMDRYSDGPRPAVERAPDERGVDERAPREGASERGDGRASGRGGRGGRGRGERRSERRPDENAAPAAPVSTGSFDGVPPTAPTPAQAADTVAAGHLADARRFLDMDSHRALRSVDEAFKSKPGFEDWYAAYRIRLEALLRLGEMGEGVRTFERFRAKLHERGRAERLEELLLDATGPLGEMMDETRLSTELCDLYDTMVGRERPFVEAATALAGRLAESGDPRSLHEAVALLREAIAKGGDEAHTLWAEVGPKARAAGVPVDGADVDAVRARVAAHAGPTKVVVVAGDESSRPHERRLAALARGLGIEATFLMGGARPPARTLEDVASAVEGAAAVLVLHNVGGDVREGVRALAKEREIACRELPFAGAAGFEPEVLAALDAVF